MTDIDTPLLENNEDIFDEFENLNPEQREELNELYHNHFDEVGGANSKLSVSEQMIDTFSGDLLIGVISAIAAGIFGWVGLTVLLVAAVLPTITLRFFQKKILQRMGNTKEITPDEYPFIYDIFREACHQVGVEPNSVCFEVSKNGITHAGAAPKIRYIIISNSTIEKLNADELSGILQHELTHITEGVQPQYVQILPAVLGISSAMVLFSVTNDFLLIGGISSLVSITANSIARYRRVSDEIKADKGVSSASSVSLATGLIRISMGKAAHVESDLMLFIHSIIDPHPPVNKRIEYILQRESDSNITPDKREDTMEWLNIIRVPIGLVGMIAVLIGYLSAVSPNVSPSIAVFGFALLVSDSIFDNIPNKPEFRDIAKSLFSGVALIAVLIGSIGSLVQVISVVFTGGYFGGIVKSAGVGVLAFFVGVFVLKTCLTVLLLFVDSGDFTVNSPRDSPTEARGVRQENQESLPVLE